MSLKEKIEAAAVFLRKKLGDRRPETLVICGSGFKQFGDQIPSAFRIAMGDVPFFAKPTVAGHGGDIVVGSLKTSTGATEVMVFTGRVHMYEGHSAEDVVFPLRVAAAIGVKRVLLTNAAGSLEPTIRPGSLLPIKDQINLSGRNCLIGGAHELGPIFVDMGSVFDQEWRTSIKKTLGLTTEGVYMGVMGPTYETPAEAVMFRGLGAHVIGMSTVQEVIAARQLGLKIACLSFVTNMAGGIGEPLTHQDVLKLVDQHAPKLVESLKKVLAQT